MHILDAKVSSETEVYSANSSPDFSSQSKLNIVLLTSSFSICIQSMKRERDKNSVGIVYSSN
jgi:hypothetical protein